MLSNVDVLNLALRHIGHQPVVSFEDTSPQAVNGRVAWALVIRDFLAAADWTFATKYANLVAFPKGDVWEFTNLHMLPTDFERLSSISGFTITDKYSIILKDGVKLFASNKADVSIKYVSNDFPISVMSGLALNAFVTALSLHLDLMLNGGVNTNNLLQFAGEALSVAIRHEGTARSGHSLSPSPLAESRNG